MTRRTGLKLLPVLAVAAVTVAVARRQPEWALASSAGELAIEVVAGVALAGAALTVRARGPDPVSGALLYGAAVAWLMGEWNNPGALGPLVFTLGMVFAYTAPALVAHALLVHGTGRLGSPAARAAVGAAYAALAGLAGVASTAALDPGEAGCATCPRNLLAVANAPDTAAALQRWGFRVGIVALALVAALAVWRAWRASPAAARTVAPRPGSLSWASSSPSSFTIWGAAGRDSTGSTRRCGWLKRSLSSRSRSASRGSGSRRGESGIALPGWSWTSPGRAGLASWVR